MTLALSEEVPAGIRCPGNKIPGCQSGLWAACRREGKTLRIICDSDSLLVKGMAMLLAGCFAGRSASEAEAAREETLACLFSEKNRLLSEERRRGLYRMVCRIAEAAGGKREGEAAEEKEETAEAKKAEEKEAAGGGSRKRGNEKKSMKRAMDVKVNLKPVFANVVHTDIWEGPCRVGTEEELSPVYERRAGKEQFLVWQERIRRELSSSARILEPVYIEYDESFYVPDAELAKLEADIAQVDLFLMTYRVPGIEKFHKPMSLIDRGPSAIDIVGFYRSEGLEAYMAHDYAEYRELLACLQVRKAIANTRILILSASEQFPVSVNTSNSDLYGLFTKYGLRTRRMTFRSVFDEMEKTEEEDTLAEAEALRNGAVRASIDAESISRDIRYRNAVRRLMERFDCNAFTTACKELCASRYPMRYRCTPCLTHSMFKDEGIPSACEEDLNVLMAMIVFMYWTKQAAFMGNPMLILPGMHLLSDVRMSRIVYGPEHFDKEILEIRHAVPPTRMRGLDREPMPYELGSFTHAGWGTKFQVNLAEGGTDTVTIGRFDRMGRKMIIAVGRIVGCAYRDDECSPALYLDLEGGARAYRHALAEGSFGHHQAVVYGDHREGLKKLAGVVGFELIVHH